MNKKITVCILFGGMSSEYEVSCRSAYNVYSYMDQDKYDIVLVGITKEGQWYQYTGAVDQLKNLTWQEDPRRLTKCYFSPDRKIHGLVWEKEDGLVHRYIDVCFPVLHGKNGEDGTVQGLLTLAGIPYVAPHVCASAICMNKVYTNMVFDYEKLPQAKWLYFRDYDLKKDLEGSIAIIQEAFGYHCVVKPANAGSSVGVSIVSTKEELEKALQLAMDNDDYILVEECVVGREVECAVLGNKEVRTSGVGEIVSPDGFYDYDKKYENDSAQLYIPADLSDDIVKKVQERAAIAYKAVGCVGMSRVDFFIRTSDNEVMINEINTIPGFNDISMYPKLFEQAGIAQGELIDQLLLLAQDSIQ